MDKRQLAVVAAGGVIGALTRYTLSSIWPSPWTTFAINVSGCFLIGVLMAARPERRLFLGTGVLGGFTTFSAYSVDIHLLLDRPAVAMAYLLGTLLCALMAVYVGLRVGRGA